MSIEQGGMSFQPINISLRGNYSPVQCHPLTRASLGMKIISLNFLSITKNHRLEACATPQNK